MARRLPTFGERLFKSLLEKQQHEQILSADIERFEQSRTQFGKEAKALERRIARNAKAAARASARERRRLQAEFQSLRRELASTKRSQAKTQRSLSRSTTELTRLTSGARAKPPTTARGRRAVVSRARVAQAARRERFRQSPQYRAAHKAPPFYANGALQTGVFVDNDSASFLGRYNNTIRELFKIDGDKTAIDEFIGRVVYDVNGTAYLLVTDERELRDLVNRKPIDYATQYLVRAAA